MANTDITLRADKGSALTYNEMDTNFSSFFYSASALTVEGANKLRLFYTGSSGLDAPFNSVRYTEVLLPTAQQSDISVSVPGDPTEVIFHGSDGSFAASANLKFTQTSNQSVRLGIGGNPTSTIFLKSTYSEEASNLTISSGLGNSNSSKGYLTFDQNGTTIGQLGKVHPDGNQTLELLSSTSVSIGCSNFSGTTNKKLRVSSCGVSIGNDISTNAVSPLSVIGNITVGNTLNDANTSYIGANTVTCTYLPANSVTNGLLIQSPKGTSGGHVVVGINSDNDNHESFTVVRGAGGTFNSTIATFKANGNVGINKKDPQDKFHVEGNITGSGNIQIHGSATVKTISKLATLTTDWVSSNDNYTKTLVVSGSDSTIMYMEAAPVPKGGIIMWSGAVDNVPKGWRLCEDGVGTVNGVTVPDLTDRFIVGAGDTYSVNSTGGYSSMFGSSGNGTGTNGHALTIPQIPSHYHHTPGSVFKNFAAMADDYGNNSSPGVASDSTNAYEELAVAKFCSTVISAMQENSIGGGQAHSHTISALDNRPPYYALAFIIYVGVA